MSFAKARIQRFNDLTNKVPPPGAYDPKFGSKVKGLGTEKKERFQDNKSVTSNSTESSLTISSKSTKNQLPGKFIVPQCARKRVIVKPMNTSCVKEKLKSTNQTNSKSVNKQQYNSTDRLLELQVECENKDRTIHEYEKQIEEMKEEKCKLEEQVEILLRKQIEVEEQHKKDIETMAELQQKVLDNHDERYASEAKELLSKLLDMSREKEEEVFARRKVESELRKRIAELSEKILHLESEMAKKTETYQIMILTLETKNEELLSKFKALEEEHNIQIKSLEKDKLQFSLDVDDLTKNKCELEAKLQKRQNVNFELQCQLSTLQCELDELRVDYDKLTDEIEYNKERIGSVDCFYKPIHKFDQEHKRTFIAVIQLETDLKEVTETKTSLEHELQDMKRIYTEINQRLTQAYKELEIAEEKHQRVLKEHKTEIEALQNKHSEENLKLKQLLKETTENYLNEIESLFVKKDKEVADIKKTSQQSEEENTQIKENTKVGNTNILTENDLKSCHHSEKKINTMIKETTSKIEEEMRLNDEKFKAYLVRIESERVALEDKLALRDTEIGKLSSMIEELKLSAEIQGSFSQSLQMELDKAETELVDKKAELRALKDQIRSEAAELVSRRKRFEIIMTENKASFAAVSKHLAQSNAEVERLQYELRRAEDCLQEHRELLISICSNNQVIQNYTKQLDANRQIINQIEADSVFECESIKKLYELKIDEFKQMATKEINLLRETVKKKSDENAEMKKQLDEMANVLRSSQNMLFTVERKNEEWEIKYAQLEVENKNLEEKLKNQKYFNEEYVKLESRLSVTCSPIVEKANCNILEQSKKEILEEKDRCINHKCLLVEMEKEFRASEEKLLQNLIAEKITRENVETELKILTESNNRLKKELEEINEKYAHVLGHQNHQQRIQYISQLKAHINRLEQELQSKCKQPDQQQQNVTAEKVKTQQKRLQNKGKENVIGGGVSKSSHTTPTSSPLKSLTPLRDRNE